MTAHHRGVLVGPHPVVAAVADHPRLARRAMARRRARACAVDLHVGRLVLGARGGNATGGLRARRQQQRRHERAQDGERSAEASSTPDHPIREPFTKLQWSDCLNRRMATAVVQQRKFLVLTAMIFAVAMMFIDQTIVAIAAPAIRVDSRSVDGIAVDHQRLPAGARRAVRARRQAQRRARPSPHRDRGHRRLRDRVGALRRAPRGGAAEAWLIGFRIVQGAFGALHLPGGAGDRRGTFDPPSAGERSPSSSASPARSRRSARSRAAS